MNHNSLIREMQTYVEALNKKFDDIDRQLDVLEKRVSELNGILNELQTRHQEPEIEVELLVADEEKELTDALPAAKEDNGITEEEEEEPVAKESSVLPAGQSGKERPADIKEEPEKVSNDGKQKTESVASSEVEEKHKGISFTERNSVSAPPVSDIRKAISLGDRFLFQRELFASDGEKMNKTIDILNKMQSLEEATEYIAKHFHWQEDSPATELFISILHRRFS